MVQEMFLELGQSDLKETQPLAKFGSIGMEWSLTS